jgi:hypothetical protein
MVTHLTKLLVLGLPLALMSIGAFAEATAQPAPSFRASCADLRAKLEALAWNGKDLVTIQVEGKLTLAKTTDALVHLGMCDLPAPRVLCITYELDRLKPGDTVILSGALTRPDANHVLLDPCLHHKAEQK